VIMAVPRLFTYQELAVQFGVCVRTVQNAFRDRPKLYLTRGTVRITEAELDKAIQEGLLSRWTDRRKDKRTRRPAVPVSKDTAPA
jgi:hypothetical protein